MNRIRGLFRNLIFLLRRVKKEKRPFVYVAVGDSTAEGIGATNPERNFASLVYSSIKSKIKEAKFLNLGEAGASVWDVYNKQSQIAVDANPDLIIVSVGGNDILQRKKFKSFEYDFRLLLDTLTKSKTLIVINNIPDLSIAPAIPKYTTLYARYQIQKYNNVIHKLAKEYGAVHVDMYTQSQVFKNYPEIFSVDGFHPSDAGYAIWASTIITLLNQKILPAL